MSPQSVSQELQSVGSMIKRWRAHIKIAASVAGVLLFVWLFSLLDVWLQYEKTGRFLIAGILWIAMGVAIWWIMRTVRKRFSTMGVAAMVEGAFPQLDNRLINYLQFAADPQEDVFRKAYVSQGLQGWNGLDFGEMKNAKLHKRANIALVVAVALFLVPLAFLGTAWGVSVYRVVNPFTNIKPISLTNIVSVDPGNHTVQQGSDAVLSVTVNGRSGHKVALDLALADGQEITHALGRIDETGTEQMFSYRIPKVNMETRYRFRAGDAALPEWYTLGTRPPLAIDALTVHVMPPSYTKLPAVTVDGLTENFTVPAGSTLEFDAVANQEVKSMLLVVGTESGAMQPGDLASAWKGTTSLTNSASLKLVCEGMEGDTFEQPVLYTYELDRVPGIRVISPEGRPLLTRGVPPTIAFSVSDEYGLQDISIEKVVAGSTSETKGETLATWSGNGMKEFTQTWRDTSFISRAETRLAYRIIARDNYPFGDEKRMAASSRIIFEIPSTEQQAAKRNELEKEAFAALTKVIEMQRENIAKTRMFQKSLGNSTPANWQELSLRQDEIRKLTKTLLSNPLNPLGTLTETAKKLYINEMAEVIPVLKSVPNTAESQRPGVVKRGLAMEEKILRGLTFADSAAAKAKVQRRISALSSMLRELIRKETKIISDTQLVIKSNAEVGETLVDRQDDLALDFTDLVKALKAESNEVRANDEGYSDLLMALATMAEERKIRGDMLLAAEQLDENMAGEALPYEQSALAKLEELAEKLETVQALEGMEEQETLLEEVLEAKKRLEKAEDVFKKTMEAMEMVGDQKDKSTKDVDMLEEEFEEIMKNLQEAMLEVPTDLNIFMELNVANDIVEDVFSIFEEVEQAEGSENLAAGDVKDRALAKREEYLEGMEEAKDRLDAMESWLMNKPDDMKITTEAFDQEEMPEAGIALGALQTEAEDLIGDLMEKNEEMAEEADDSATNTSVPDMVANNEVKEGDVASFAAQGKSGNETPDHKEQDGRSNVGRQGMSVGETAAGSGTINEGDKNIEERRTQEPTQSGQVDVEGEDVKTAATGGGKLGTGKADEVGMSGGQKRMDSTEVGSAEGMESLMAEQADAMYAKASTQNVRADSLRDAAHHLRQANDAVARGNIGQLKEHRKAAIAALKRAKSDIDAAMTGSFNLDAKPSFIDDVVEGGPDQAPAKYRDLVAEYYKALNEGL